jgi:Type IV secretion-system coupling protein DNA-binding domain
MNLSRLKGEVWVIAAVLMAAAVAPALAQTGPPAVITAPGSVTSDTDAAITLTSAPTTKIILRCDEPQTANWASSVIGSREVERLTLTQLAGLSTYREGANLSPHRGIEPLVLADEIKMLQPFTGYLCIAGAAGRTTIKIPELHLVRHHPAFIARPPAATPRPKTNDAKVPPIDEPTDEEIIAQLAARR